ncbi:MAG: hypothetical protein KA603_06860 [Azonexus sp.]|nr:hypothetical protein [Betaproteobacteria bacterium]MBK8917752.1 hypothetical protein [Betaproteobacteria bacterium]MBP6035839.1 hypothetical protein [Azonexus sp.]MBP6906343.1 hypothetical protein [Azonexus sp.]
MLRVAPGTALATIPQAAQAAQDGDIIEIQAGTYRGQPVVWTQKKLTIRGVGGRPVMLADGTHAEGKAAWVIRNGDIEIENIEFRGNRVPDGNGAGIRFERGRLRLRACAFFDNEMGLLTTNHPEAVLEISDSEFGAAPRHGTVLHHLLYVGGIARFTLTGSRLSGGYRGHLVKSRARENHVSYNLLVDGPEGQASYELEFPNGGVAYVVGNLIGQSAGTDNMTLVAYGAEGPRWQDNALYLAHNTLVNDHPNARFLHVWTDKIGASTEVWVLNNLTAGTGTLEPFGSGRFEGNVSVPRSSLIPLDGIPARLPVSSPLRGTVRPPGDVRGQSLLPSAEFNLPVGSKAISLPARLAPGAFQQ